MYALKIQLMYFSQSLVFLGTSANSTLYRSIITGHTSGQGQRALAASVVKTNGNMWWFSPLAFSLLLLFPSPILLSPVSSLGRDSETWLQDPLPDIGYITCSFCIIMTL